MNPKKLTNVVIGGLVALGLLGGVATATFAQTATPSAPAIVVPDTAATPGMSSRDGQALADQLGITLAALQAAEAEARVALIDQAVADGKITAAQGEALKASGEDLHGSGFGYDKSQFLAAALGISLDELQAAKLEVFRQAVAARVAAGELTQAQADLLLAQKAASYYLDADALNTQVRSAYETAVAAAVAAGDITQAQADALLAQLPTTTFNFGFGGGHGHGGHGGGHGHGGFRGSPVVPDTTAPDTTAPDTTAPGTTAPDTTTTDTSLDA